MNSPVETTEMVKVGLLKEDGDLYPRQKIDQTHVAHIVSAIKSGDVMPPLVADRKTKMLIDGAHRRRGYQRAFGPDYETPVVFKDYPNRAEMLLDAIRYNSAHGNNLTASDRAHCRILSQGMKIPPVRFCEAMRIPLVQYGGFKVAFMGKGKGRVDLPLKPGMRHLAGQELTPRQVEVNDHLNGNDPLYLVKCITELLEVGAFDLDDEKTVQRLTALHQALEKLPLLV